MTAHAIAMLVYLIAIFALAIWARGRAVKGAEDYIVAGRRLSFPLATATLLATWFGAGTLLHATNDVRENGLRVTALEPLGPGLCLILAGLLFARPLWNAKVLTIYDFYSQKFGRRVEWVSSLYAVSFFGWIATQILGVAGILHVFFDMEVSTGIWLVTGVATAYTLIGGMWSVTITDAAQLVLLIAGLFILAFNVLTELGGSPVPVIEATPDKHLVLIPTETLAEFFDWLSLFLAGTLGIIPSQDLFQRVFASRTSKTAVWACIVAGLLYITLGLFPVLFGLAGKQLLPDDDSETVAALAQRLLSPAMAVVFTIALLSTILSTIDSAILAPASVFAQNVWRHFSSLSVLTMTQICIVGVSAVSLGLAFTGEETSELLAGSYSMTLPSLVVLTCAVYQKKPRETPALAVLVYGLLVWILEQLGGWEMVPFGDMNVPIPVVSFATSILLYFAVDQIAKMRRS